VLLGCLVPAAVVAEEAKLTGQVEVWEQIGGKLARLEEHSNAVIFLAGFTQAPDPAHQPQLVQKNKSFSARVLAITAGESVAFPNADSIHHNVWSKSRARSFDLGLYQFPESRTVDFPVPGILTVFCNIHPQMIATILVLPNHKYTVTGPSGAYGIGDIAAGEYTVYAWVEGAVPVQQAVRFAPGATVTLDFRLKLERIPLRHLNKEGKPYRKYPE
jgi:plastocyanin